MILKIFLYLLYFSTLIGQTESQIKRAKEFAKTSGMSKKEVISIAKSKGYSDSAIEKALTNETGSEKKSTEVDKGQTKVVEMTNEKSSTEQKVVENEDSKISNADSELPIIDEFEFDEIKKESNETLKNTVSDNSSLKYFGYDIFKNDPKLFQLTSVGLVNPNYLIGPGDEIIVMLWGETQFRQVLTVDREGFIFIPEVGQVFVNGLNMNLLESKLFRVLSQSYASLNKQGGKATTFLDVSLGNLRPLRIQVLGEVSQPGAYTVSPSATLFSSLYYFNGPTFLGSLRDIKLIRNNQEVTSIDFYNYLLTGKKLSDTNLQLDDVIFIPKRLKSVSIGGEINRPGIYELKSKESLKDLILMSGGLKTTAYLERAQIDRIVAFEDREKMGMERMLIDVNINDLMNDKSSFSLKDGDKVEIFSILEIRQNYVEISGAVTRPGSYDIGSGLRLSELILKSDSLLGDAYLDRVDITRIKSDFTEQLIKLNLGKVLDKETENDIRLQGLDRVKVYSMRDMIPNTSVSISGYVKFPGKYLLQENMTLYDLIFKAGGYVDQEYKKQVYLDRAELIRTFKNNEKEVIPFNLGEVLDNKGIANTKLLPNDAIRTYGIKEVEGDTRYVSISGNVKKPGKYELYQMNMTIYDLIFKAGGFKDELYRGTTYLQRADLYRFDDNRITKSIIPFHLGKVIEDSTHVDNIELKPGDEIIVYSKNIFEKVKPINITGTIIKPGSYKYKTDMNLKDLILEAGEIIKRLF